MILRASPTALALEYKSVSEREIEQMLDETRAKYGPQSKDRPCSNNPYLIVFRRYEEVASYAYYFTDCR